MENRKTNSGRLAYGALLIFSVLYYARPEDIIPGLHFIPWSKISGGIALLAVVPRQTGKKNQKKIFLLPDLHVGPVLPIHINDLVRLFVGLCLPLSIREISE